MCYNIISKLQSFIPSEVLNKYSDRILFAIGILSMECWLVTIVNSRHTNKEINNCLYCLNRSLLKKNVDVISEKNKNSYKSRTVYKKLANKFKNKKIIDKFAKQNTGFEYFVEQLKNIKR